MKIFGIICAAIVSLVILGSLMFGLTWLGIEWRGFFGPKRAEVERNIFEQTKSYNHGQIQQLTRYRKQYYEAETEDERKLIASTVRMQFASFDINSVPHQELKDFWLVVNDQ